MWNHSLVLERKIFEIELRPFDKHFSLSALSELKCMEQNQRISPEQPNKKTFSFRPWEMKNGQ